MSYQGEENKIFDNETGDPGEPVQINNNGDNDKTAGSYKIGTTANGGYGSMSEELYNSYQQHYMDSIDPAVKDVMANAAFLTGGYGNSYAVTAGQQVSQQNEEMKNIYTGVTDWGSTGDLGIYDGTATPDDTTTPEFSDDQWNKIKEIAGNNYLISYTKEELRKAIEESGLFVENIDDAISCVEMTIGDYRSQDEEFMAAASNLIAKIDDIKSIQTREGIRGLMADDDILKEYIYISVRQYGVPFSARNISGKLNVITG